MTWVQMHTSTMEFFYHGASTTVTHYLEICQCSTLVQPCQCQTLAQCFHSCLPVYHWHNPLLWWGRGGPRGMVRVHKLTKLFQHGNRPQKWQTVTPTTFMEQFTGAMESGKSIPSHKMPMSSIPSSHWLPAHPPASWYSQWQHPEGNINHASCSDRQGEQFQRARGLCRPVSPNRGCLCAPIKVHAGSLPAQGSHDNSLQIQNPNPGVTVQISLHRAR